MTNAMSYSDVNSYFSLNTLFSKATDGYKNHGYTITRNNDLGPLIISSVRCDKVTLVFKKPLLIEIKKEYFDNELAYTAVNKDFYIDIYDDSIENLKLAVEENICFLWETYVCANNDKLTKRARKIKDFYLKNIIA